MGFAFLFDPPVVGGSYSAWARSLTFRSGVLQEALEPVRIREGDLLGYIIPPHVIPHDSIGSLLDASNASPGYMRTELDGALGRHRIHVQYCPDLIETTALQLHDYLITELRYMGCYGVDQSNGLHHILFDRRLILSYRIFGRECIVIHPEEIQEISELGCFRSVMHGSTFGDHFVDIDGSLLRHEPPSFGRDRPQSLL